MSWYDEEKYMKWYAAASVCLIAGALFLGLGAGRERDMAEAVRLRNETAQAYAAAPPASLRPVPALFAAQDFYSLRDRLGESGAVITSVTEEPPQEMEEGRILKMICAGRGSFAQLLSLFDIIQMKTYWVAAELRHAERKDGALLFEVELSAYQGRGNYEEKKYRIDRSHGDGQEPGRADPR